MPGLRVAYAVSPAACTGEIAQALPSWPVTTLVAFAISAALADPPTPSYPATGTQPGVPFCSSNWNCKDLLCTPSAANFLVLQLPGHMQAATLRDTLIRHEHIVVRARDTFKGLSPNHLRAAFRSGQDNTRLASAVAIARTVERITAEPSAV